MIKIKKITSYTILVTIILSYILNCSMSAYADDKVDNNNNYLKIGSYVDANSMSVNKVEFTSGDKVEISYKLNISRSDIESVSTVYSRAITGHWYWVNMIYNQQSDTYEGEKNISNYTEEGIWAIAQIHIECKDGSRIYVNNINDSIYDTGEDLSGGNFFVSGTDSDIEKPTILPETLNISKTNVVSGEILKIGIKIKDDKSGISTASIMYREPEYRSVTLEYNKDTDIYEGYFTVDENTKLGDWKVSQIYVVDNVSNYIYYNNNPSGTGDNDVNLNSANFRVMNATDFIYEKNGDSIDIIKYVGKNSDIKIPAFIDGYKVRSISHNAFSENLIIENVVVEEGIEEIGWGAFDKCKNLKTVKLPDSINEIHGNAFRDCYNLIEINLPSKLKIIQDGVFNECWNLNKIKIPSTVEHIKAYAFNNCKSLKEITIQKNVKILEYNTFTGCENLENIFFESKECEIDNNVFEVSDKLTINCYIGSTVSKTAILNNLNFIYYEDINADNKIDINDLSTLSFLYNETEENSENWNWIKDINRDGIIDLYDIIIISKNIR